MLKKIKMEKIKTVPVTYNFLRQNAALIDRKSIFLDLESAKKYAETDPTKYVGQILTVVETENTVQIYKIINKNGTLKNIQKFPSFTRFKVKVSANTTEEKIIGQIIPFPNETVTIDWGDNEQTEVTISQEKIQHKFPEISEDKEYIGFYFK